MSGDSAAECRHCGKRLERIDAGWVDGAGFFACVEGGLPGSGPRGPVLHDPMPAGPRGSASSNGEQQR